ncbi:MAG: hypothetical protein ACK55I_02795, partial [bacterium]
ADVGGVVDEEVGGALVLHEHLERQAALEAAVVVVDGRGGGEGHGGLRRCGCPAWASSGPSPAA